MVAWMITNGGFGAGVVTRPLSGGILASGAGSPREAMTNSPTWWAAVTVRIATMIPGRTSLRAEITTMKNRERGRLLS
jgi:hypothetical protein